MPHTLDNNQWQHAALVFENGLARVSLINSQGSQITVLNNVAVPGWLPIRARYGFGARTGGATNRHLVDRVFFVATSLAADCDDDGVPDACSPDADGDGVPDACDLCPGTIPGALVGADGCPEPAIPGDFDNDGDVDGDDINAFAACATRAGVPMVPGCEAKDFDSDADGDLDDFATLQRCFRGADIRGESDCAD